MNKQASWNRCHGHWRVEFLTSGFKNWAPSAANNVDETKCFETISAAMLALHACRKTSPDFIYRLRQIGTERIVLLRAGLC